MEEEIDLRAYIAVLLKYRFWIAGLVVIAAAVAFGVSALQPRIYQATAQVAILETSYEMDISSGVQRIQLAPSSSKAAPSLALRDNLIEALSEALTADIPAEQRSPGTLRASLRARTISSTIFG